MQFSRLRLYCETPYTKNCLLSVSLFDTVSGKECFAGLIPSNKSVYFMLERSEYTLRIQNDAGLDLTGITKWINLKKCNQMGLHIIFERSQRRVLPTVTVNITAKDANYPNIIPINGGITVCQYRIMT